MNRIQTAAALVTLACLTPCVAQADETYVLQQDIVTDWMGNRFSGDGFSVAKRQLQDDYAAARRAAKVAIVEASGVVISAKLQEWGVGDEDKRQVELTGWAVNDGTHNMVRRRGRMDLLFQLPGELPSDGVLSKAFKVDSRSQVSVSVQARRTGSASGYLRRPPRYVAISLNELRQIQKAPAGARHTAVGAVLRRAWTEALNGNEDDVEGIDALVTVELNSLRPIDARATRVTGQRLDALTADLVLGRRGTHGDWWADLVGRKQPLPEVDDETAQLLYDALRRVAPAYGESDASQEEWDRVAALRAGDPAGLTSADRAFLRTGRSASGAANQIPQ